MSTRSAALLVLLGALWGGSFVFMRVAVPALGPVALSFVRVALAAAILLAVAGAQRGLPDLSRHWRAFAVVGAVNSALPFALFSYAAQHLTVSTLAILNATSPFFGAALAALWLGEPLTRRKLAGLALGITGVAVLAGWKPEALAGATGLAMVACLGGALCYALAGASAKRRLAAVPSFAVAAASQLFAAIALAPALPFAGVPGPVTPLVVANVVALAAASTAVAYLIYFKLIADIGPARALTVTFLIPLFGALWGFVFLGEALTADMLVGGALVVGGTVLALRGK